MIVLGINQSIFPVSALGQRGTAGHLDIFCGSQPRGLRWWEFEEDLGAMNTLHLVNINKGKPDLSDFGFAQIRTSCVNHEEWSDRFIVMGVHSLLLEDEKSWGSPLVEICVLKFNRFFAWISSFILYENLL